MKNTLIPILAFFIIPCLAGATEPWGHLKSEKNNKTDLIITKIANGEPITYCSYISPKYAHNITEAELDSQIEAAIHYWMEASSEIIKKDKQNFQDITAILDKPLKLEKQPLCNMTALSGPHQKYFTEEYFNELPMPDLTVIYNPPYCNNVDGANGASFFKSTATPMICLNNFTNNTMRTNKNGSTPFYYDLDSSQYILLHEFGHALGLADQYEEGLIRTDPIFSSINPGIGLMSCASLMTCDDVDGLITKLDRITGTKRVFKSLCDNGTIYKYSKPVFDTGIRKESQYTNGYDQTINVITIITPESSRKNAYEEEVTETYILNGRTRFTLEEEVDFSKYDIKTYYGAEFKIILKGLKYKNNPIGTWTRTLTIGPYTLTKTFEVDKNGNIVKHNEEFSENKEYVDTLKKELAALSESDKKLQLPI